MSDDVEDRLLDAHARIDGVESRLERMFRFGKILDPEDIDLSDPTNPVARIHHDNDDAGKPVKGPFVRYATIAGDRNQHTPPSVGQQFLHISPDGEMESGLLVPLGHSNAIPSPETDGKTHVDQFGQVKRTLKQDSLTHTVGGVQLHTDTKGHKVTAPGTVQITAGDPSAANSSGFGGSLLSPHEMNRVLQSLVARADQSDHHHTAMHQEVSTMVDKLLPLCPALSDQHINTLNHKSDGLKQAADNAAGMLPDYAENAIRQTLGKLLNSPLGAVLDAVQGDIGGQMGKLLGQVGSMMGGAGLSGGAAAAAQMFLGQAQAGLSAAVAGGNADLDSALSSLTGLAAGSPIAGMLGDAVGQLRGLMGSTSGLMGGLSGLINGQTNAAKGEIKSALFGGYGGS